VDGLAWVADALIVVGLLLITLWVYGVLRLPDVNTQLHTASRAAFLGASALLAAGAIGDPGLVRIRVAPARPGPEHRVGEREHDPDPRADPGEDQGREVVLHRPVSAPRPGRRP